MRKITGMMIVTAAAVGLAMPATAQRMSDGRTQAEIEATKALNAEMAAKAKADAEAINASKTNASASTAANEARQKEYEAQRAAWEAEVARIRADNERRQADYRACLDGDKSRCPPAQ